MAVDIAIVLLLVIGMAGCAKVYIDWSRFERGVRGTNFVDSKEVKKVAIKIGITSAIAGLALGLSIIVMRLSSPPSSTEEVSALLYIAYAVFCTIGCALFALFMFGAKVFTLISMYKEKHPKP
jgi:hypothetical protein